MPRYIGTCFRFYTGGKKTKILHIEFIVTSHNSVLSRTRLNYSLWAVLGRVTWTELLIFAQDQTGRKRMYTLRSTEEHGQKISFLKSAKNVFFRAQNMLDPLLSLYMHFFIPKVLLKDQKMLNLRRIKNDERGPSDLCASLTHLLKQTEAKRQAFM